MVTLSCAELTTTEINIQLARLPDGTQVTITEPRGRHNIAVGLPNQLDITISGNAGYYIGGLCDGPDITVEGFVGWSVGENLMAGTVRIRGNASECAGATSHGGTIVSKRPSVGQGEMTMLRGAPSIARASRRLTLGQLHGGVPPGGLGWTGDDGSTRVGVHHH